MNDSRMGALITDAYAVRAATSVASTLHSQHGLALLLGLEGDISVRSPGRADVRGRVLWVPPHVRHTATCEGPSLAFLYFPEAAPHLVDTCRTRDSAVPLEGRLAARLSSALTAHRASLSQPQVLDGLARESVTWLAREAPRRAPDRRVLRVLEALREPSPEWGWAAARSGLSPAHLRALFVRDVGLPPRTFRLWRRLLVALGAFARLDATSAAHAAGFADLAHFSRTCRRMLGYSPTSLRDGLLGP